MNFRIESATGVLREVLLCRPKFYEWLPTSHAARESIAIGIGFDRKLAENQHDSLVSALLGAGVNCRFIEPEPNLPDLCWTRDSSQITPWGPIITDLSAPERSAENDVLRQYYDDQSVPISRSITAGHIEGGDIQIIRPGLLAVGYSEGRSSKAAAGEFAGWFDEQGWDTWLQPVADRFVHLDVTFCMAATNVAIVCNEATGDELPGWLRKHGIHVVSVGMSEAEKLACNCLALGSNRTIIAGHGLDVTADLRQYGIDVTELDLDMFTRAGGAVHCLTQPLRRDAIEQ